jgi:amino acid adenylation domain-containing protein
MNNDAGIEDIYSLTSLQQGMLFHGLYEPESRAYWEQLSVTLGGDLDPVVFHRSWLDAVAHHAALRTHFHWEELDEPLQVVQQEISLPWHEEDWQSLSPAAFAGRLRELLDADRQRGFEFGKAPLMRLYLIRGPDSRFTFVWSHHHILLDGWSGAIVFRDVLALYEAQRRGEVARLKRPRPFRDYVLWLQDHDDTSAKAFWQKHLEGMDGPTKLAAGVLTNPDRQIPRRYRQEARSLAKSTTELVRPFLRQQRLTLNTVIQGAWSLLLSHYCGEFDVVFGTVVSGRPPDLRGAEDMVGLLINTIPVRVSLDPGADVLPWLLGLQSAQVERDRHAHLSLAEILSATGLPRDMPLFESIVSVENYPVDSSLGADPSALRIEHLEAFEQTNYPLAVVVSPDDEQITLKITADADRFEAAALQRMLGHLCQLMASIMEPSTAKLVDLALEPAAETVLPASTSCVAEGKPDEAGVHRCFELQCQRTPHATAVVCDAESLTYKELNERANRLARYLQDNGIARDILVGICANRSLDMVVALLAVLKAGGAYVPLDPGYPVERLRFMLADAQLALVVTDASVEAALREELTAQLPQAPRLVNLGQQEQSLAGYAADNLCCDATTGEDLAYVIYTSGSTGRPKGVMITHGALLNHMRWMIGEFSFDASVRVLQKTPFSFDASVWEFFLPLMSGGTLVLARPDGHLDLDYLIDVMTTQQIVVLQGVPSLLEALVGHSGFDACVSLTHVFSGGEVLTESLRRRLQARTSATVCNLYGPTESCIDATFHVCERNAGSSRDGDVPIGQPIANTFLRVRDAWGHTAPVGVVGELLIGGKGLARGYWNRPDLTGEKFVLDPPGGRRVYRTGDLVQRRSDGALHFVERLDQQVKLRGYRIELGEIENILEHCPGIERAVVVVRADDVDHHRLVAYMTSSGGHDDVVETVRATMKRLLPNYMVPADYVVVDQFPLTPNGKVDRRLLVNRPLPAATANRYDAPVSETEQQLASIWQEVLNSKHVGRAGDFFQLGGHSLTAMQVLSRIRDTFHVKIPLRILFELPVLSELAQRIETHQAVMLLQNTSSIDSGDDVEEISL